MRSFAAILALGASLLAGSALAQETQETRVGEQGFESPPATIAAAQWLIGQWSGTGIGGAPAHESWLAPAGTTMVGTFVQETADGAILFTEHMYLMEEGGSLVLKLKHFNADLTGWEEKDGMLTFRLIALEACAAYFNALTLRCDGGDGLLAAVRMRRKDGTSDELLFRFQRVSLPQSAFGCDGTTIEINQCLSSTLSRADDQRKTYFAAAIGEADPESEVVRQMRNSESGFETYREHECSAVYEQWKDGTIRNAMYLRCAIRLTDQRTHTIWQNWLTYQDSSEPILPEPSPMR